MSVTAQSAAINTPMSYEIQFGIASASGVISVGDYLAFSGNAVFATNVGHTAYWKASGAGIALESNPQYDMMGRIVTASALRYLREGTYRASASFSGQPALGNGVVPAATGSAVGAPTGLTGVGSTWNTAAKQTVSGGTGVGGSGIGVVINWINSGPAGTGQIEFYMPAPRPDYY